MTILKFCVFISTILYCATPLAFIGDPAFTVQNTVHTPGVD